MATTHAEISRRYGREGLSGKATGWRCDDHDLDPVRPHSFNCWEQVSVASHEKLDIGPLLFRLCSLHHHFDSEIHVGLLLCLKSDIRPAACALSHLLLI